MSENKVIEFSVGTIVRDNMNRELGLVYTKDLAMFSHGAQAIDEKMSAYDEETHLDDIITRLRQAKNQVEELERMLKAKMDNIQAAMTGDRDKMLEEVAKY